jgi:hypothetical protein
MSNNELEIITGGALEAITRGEIDTQIATAHRFPRSLSTFKKRALEMVSLDEETAASCIYSRPVGKENGKPVYAEGLSVRTAEIVGACYGNLRVGAMVIEQTERYVKARGFAHDLESNFASSSEVIESTVDKYGKPYSERMRVVIAKAAVAKARRDATFQVVPKALCKPLEAEARQIAIGDASTLEKRRAAVMAWVNKLGIPVERVFNALNIKGEEEIGIDQLLILTGLKTAIKDGDTSIDEAFPIERTEIQMPRKKSDAPQEPPAQPADNAEHLPEFTGDTPQKALALKLRDAGISEADFFAYLKQEYGFKRVKIIASMTDAEANDGLFRFDEVAAAVKKGGQ